MKQKLLELKEILNKKESTERKFDLVKSEFNQLQLEVNQAKEVLTKETKDVDKLDGVNLTILFYSAIGKKDEKKDKEKTEMETAQTVLKNLKEKLKIKEEEYKKLLVHKNEILTAENQYNFMLSSVELSILSSKQNGADDIIKLNDKLKDLRNLKQELSDTLQLLSTVENQGKKTTKELESSESLGVFDLVTDNLAISMMKRNQLDNAKNEVEKLKNLLDKFQSSLQKSNIQSELKLSYLDDSWRMIDIFMDNVFTDWTVLNDIQRVLSKVRELNKKLSEIRTMLAEKQKLVGNEEIFNHERKLTLLENAIMQGA